MPCQGGRGATRLWSPMERLPAPRDQIEVSAGCDKSFETCRAKFDNLLNSRVFPFCRAVISLWLRPRFADTVHDAVRLCPWSHDLTASAWSPRRGPGRARPTGTRFGARAWVAIASGWCAASGRDHSARGGAAWPYAPDGAERGRTERLIGGGAAARALAIPFCRGKPGRHPAVSMARRGSRPSMRAFFQARITSFTPMNPWRD